MSDQAVMVLLGDLVRPSRPRVKPEDHPALPFLGMEHVEAHTMNLFFNPRLGGSLTEFDYRPAAVNLLDSFTPLLISPSARLVVAVRSPLTVWSRRSRITA